MKRMPRARHIRIGDFYIFSAGRQLQLQSAAAAGYRVGSCIKGNGRTLSVVWSPCRIVSGIGKKRFRPPTHLTHHTQTYEPVAPHNLVYMYSHARTHQTYRSIHIYMHIRIRPRHSDHVYRYYIGHLSFITGTLLYRIERKKQCLFSLIAYGRCDMGTVQVNTRNIIS